MAQKITSYIKTLRFDKALNNLFIAKYLSNPRLAIVILLAVIVLGVTSYISLPRTLNPEIKIPIIIISTALPGASPDDVESLVTIPIENSLSNISDIETIQSSSRESFSIVNIEFKSGVDPEKVKADVQSEIDSLTDLPEDALKPTVVKLDFENQPIWTLALTGKETASLNRLSRSLQKELEDLDSVGRVTLTGLEREEIQILIKPDVFAKYSINPQTLSGAIKASLLSLPSGSIKAGESSFTLGIDKGIIDVDDVRSLKMNLNSEVVELSNIADISIHSKPVGQLSFLSSPDKNPVRIVNFDIYRNTSFKIDETIREVERVFKKNLENKKDYQILSVVNSGELVEEQFKELTRDFTVTVSLVFLSLLIFLGLRQALVASVSIPLTFLITFAVMNNADISLSFVSFFSLLLVLGLVVDDTIVVISAMTAYFRSKKFTSFQTALLVWRDFVVAILTTTLTTVWAFLPLLLSTGIIGEFIKPIPIVVSTALIASFFIAMFLTMPFVMILLEGKFPKRVSYALYIGIVILFLAGLFLLLPDKKFFPLEVLSAVIFLVIFLSTRKNIVSRILKSKLVAPLSSGFIHFDIFSLRYRSLIYKILSSKSARLKTLTAVIIFTFFSFALLPTGLVKSEFFPDADQDYVFMNVELPVGTGSEKVERKAKEILKKLRETKELEFATANIGQSFQDTGITSGEGSNILFSIKLKDDRKVTSIEVGEYLRKEFKNYPAGKVSVTESTGGPPAGADLQIKLFGEDLTKVDSFASRIEDYLNKERGVTNVEKSIRPGFGKVVFVPDETRIADLGLTKEAIGFWLRTYASGFEIDNIKLKGDKEDTDITLRFSSKTQAIEELSSLLIPTKDGPTPVLSLGSLKLSSNPTLITREDGKRTISVQGSVLPGYVAADLNRELETFANSINLPEGYSWSTGGVNEENQQSVNSILQAMVLSFLLIVITMVIQFSSFRKAAIVMLVIPLSISGVFIVFGLTNTPLSFPALIGILALFGIVVKNSILIVDKIGQNIKAGLDFNHAISDGASSRLEPIALTSFAAILGLTPITLSDPIWRGLGGSIIAGLTFSGTIMLFFIPVVYYYLVDKNPKRK